MAILTDDARTRRARSTFQRLIVYPGIASVATVAAIFYCLSWNGPLTPVLVLTTSIGVFISILLGGGLTAAGFLGSKSGQDERTAGATAAPPVIVE